MDWINYLPPLGIVAVRMLFAIIPAVLLAILLGVPFAIYNKARGGEFRVGKSTRAWLTGLSFIVIMSALVVSMQHSGKSIRGTIVSAGVRMTAQYRTVLADYYIRYGSFDGVEIKDLGGQTSSNLVSEVRLHDAMGARIAVAAAFAESITYRDISGREFRIATLDGGLTWHCGNAIPDAALRGSMQVPVDLLPGPCK